MSSLNISNFIWGIADDVLRDTYVRGKYRDVILPMTVIRRLDAVLEPTKNAVLQRKAQLDEAGIANQDFNLRQASGESFYNASPFRLRDLTSRAHLQQLRSDFEAYLDGFSSNIREVLDKFEFRNQIPRLVDTGRLGFLLEKFLDRSINLSPRPVLNADGSVRIEGLDNHSMGTVFEELIRRFNEENNEEAGEHFTPRDVVQLMARLVFLPVADQIKPATYLVYDGACGTGGMLTVAEETLMELAAEQDKEVSIHLYGQEVNAETYAISKADLILKGEGVEADNMRFGSTLSDDEFPAHEFDFMLSNPPYGKSWKIDLEDMGGKSGITDPRFIVEHGGDPDYALITRSSDGQMMFLANMLSKMKTPSEQTPIGSRIAEVHNGSSLFTGDAGQGESNIRRWIIENDWLEANRECCVDVAQFTTFLHATQPVAAESQDLGRDSPTRRKFLARLQGEVSKRGTIDLLRKGVKHGPHQIDLMYGTPSPGNEKAAALYTQNRFSVTRQLRYSNDNAQLALDVCLFVNGLPVATFELKNRLTKQTVEDAVEQYKRDRNPRERLFELGRCLVHFAVDDNEVKFCTHLRGKASWFLPFNKGWNDGAGNPPNPSGLKTDYLWKQVLTREGLTDIIENYAQIVESKDDKTGHRKRDQIWPRYHQLDVVRGLLADASKSGVGSKYLIQHSAGSGKSNSIAWLAYQLIGLKQEEKNVFDSVIVVTDRKVLDRQIRDTIKQFAQVGSTVGHAQDAAHLRTLLQQGKRVVISTVQKFPFIVGAIGSEHQGRRFAIIIDEAHSSQGGKTSASMSTALGEANAEGEDDTTEDKINRIMESKKLLTNASYFAFTATPKNKTLEIFGEPWAEGGTTKHRPFHSYTMKQAIQEGFIIDVLAHYTPVNSYYRLMKTVEGDPEFDIKRANKKLRRYVEDNDHSIRLKAEMMVDHFHDNVVGQQKIGGTARAMVVTSSINRAITYFHAISSYLAERKSPYRAIVAFSGEPEYEGAKVSEASLNGFSSNLIEERIQEDPYRFLVCADKFQTGYDEPLLHTMYVDKVLSGVKAVQTLSRLNRANPKKHDAFVLDFTNDSDTIQDSFADYYRTTILAEETDPNRLHDLKAALDGYQVYAPAQVDELVELYLGGADRDKLDPILDACVEVYREQLVENGQVDFKGKAKAFLRSYGFLAAILPYSNAEWEKLSIFLTFLVPKLPAPAEDDLSKGILQAIDMDSYRVEKQAVQAIQLADEDAEIQPVDTSGGGQMPEPEMDRLSNIVKEFNNRFGNIEWKDQDKIEKVITEELPAKVAANQAYKNAMANSDKQNARIEHDKALAHAMNELLADHTELFKQFSDNESFRHWVTEMSFAVTYMAAAAGRQPPPGSPSP